MHALITSADEIGEVLFSVAFVCLSVCPDDNSRTVIDSNMRFSGLHITMPRKSPSDFSDNLDIRPDIRPDKISSNSTDFAETCWMYL